MSRTYPRPINRRLLLSALLPATLALVIGPQSIASSRAQTTADELVSEMREGGVVVFLRHARTVQSQIDTGRLGDREGQRNLSKGGIAQAQALGGAFRALDISFVRVLASPVFRARDTAELAFGPGNFEVSMDIVADDYAGGAVAEMIEATRDLLLTPPPRGESVLLVGHRTPLALVTGKPFPDSVLPEGAMAIFRPDAGEAIRFLGAMTADQLIEAAP